MPVMTCKKCGRITAWDRKTGYAPKECGNCGHNHQTAEVSPSNSSGLVMWRDERVKDADGFLARRLLGWFLQRDMILLGSCFAMEYGKAKRYVHPSEVILTT